MLINLSEIMSVKGNVRKMEVPVELEDFQLDGTNYRFVCKDPVALVITYLGEKKVSVEGSTSLSLLIPCSRCLEEVETRFDISVSKEIDLSDSDDDRIKQLDEANYIRGNNLDVDLLVYDEVLINFPMKVLCCEDCKGICSVCGANLNKESCTCDRMVKDPRMAAIQDIFNNFKEV